ncbi:MAG: S-layer homology domain-containing protein, partial [Clostridia bacterium]|nr:S-layer homology domain-containing protein [Clostridia bacterium]
MKGKRKAMKKATAIILFVLMTLSSLSMLVSANSINWDPGNCTPDGVTATVRKSDAVVIDGVINEGEYDNLDINNVEDESFLNVCFHTSDDLDPALAMLPTTEFYASWNDGYIYVAVKNKPHEIKQTIGVRTDIDYPEDWFCEQVAYTISSDVKQARDRGKQCNFYFAISKRTDTDEYQLGYYGVPYQWGNSETYRPVAGEDFAISYDFDSGYSYMEWRIPFAEICETGTAGAGDCVYLSIGAEAGDGNGTPGDESQPYYGISLGDYTYGVAQKSAKNHAAFELSDEKVPGPAPAINFTDVPADAYFADAVAWAVSKNVTTGTSPTTFSPSNPCTRAQVVTFLWRAAGEPKPTKSDNPFTDV